MPFYRLCPKDPVQQIAWRLYVRKRAMDDKDFRHAVIQACEEDLLFFCNTLGWIFEPRIPESLPLNTWTDQDDHLCWLDECYGKRDCVTEKSRDLSLTWDHLIVFYSHWYHDKNAKTAIVSLTEDKADSDDSDSLMWKMRFFHANMPEWWRNAGGNEDCLLYLATGHRFTNLRNGSTSIGYACTQNFLRGGRKIAALMDEFSEWPISIQQKALDSSQYACGSRFWPSTFSCDSDRFFDIARRERSSVLKIIADWKDNPAQAAGLYTSEAGRLKFLDTKYKHAPNYQFILDGKIRSPYYDDKCKQAGATPQSIARELDRDPAGATGKVFLPAVLQMVKESCEPPFFRGMIDFKMDGEYEPIWMPQDDGRFSVWRTMTKPAKGTWYLGFGGPYSVGCDIAGGSGNSQSNNSAIEVFDISNGEQVLEFYSNTIIPRDFAQLVFSVCKWLCIGHDLSWAYLNFENQGIAGTFTNEIIKLGWPNVYMTRMDQKFSGKRTETVGCVNKDGGYNWLSNIQKAIQVGGVTIKSHRLVHEFGEYDMVAGGKCEHSSIRKSPDPSETGTSHGDNAIAAALSWLAAEDRPTERLEGGKIDEQQELFEQDEMMLKQFERGRKQTDADLRYAIH